nr:immunoglobulin light chain junction region [Macaca mulatta]MOX97732.1 immunoglobulin light chain junction region [Macaca mulatta]MOX98798.1 immunoglobulin light chain junction region [Macaca mulatta]MOX99118.1 immunoglobulin light chain junction region [Macaca mulatta]MOX99694.1 immunoglobulin light chain junction region [Macaca mulatta]
CLQHNSDPFTF